MTSLNTFRPTTGCRFEVMYVQKTCFKCGRLLSLDQFYRHPQMLDGHLNKCRECARSDARQNRRRRIDYYRQYDHARRAQPQRVEARKTYVQRQRVDEPLKHRARTMAGNALRDGRLRREPCHFCGATDQIEMHHPDYRFPLRVYWLCRRCHRKLDNMNKLGLEGDVGLA